MTNSPYSGLGHNKFWRTGVVGDAWLQPGGIYTPKTRLNRTDRVMTAGSCFAQHIATNLRRHGFDVIDTEPPPPGMPDNVAKEYGYRLYSARYANVYTAAQLRQLMEDALSGKPRAVETWTRGDRYFDALRPSVEPNGLDTVDEVIAHRAHHLKRVASAVESADVFVFTFGLTEAWINPASGTVYPTAPGTIAGSYDPATCQFVNFEYPQVYEDFFAARRLLKQIRPDLRFLVTVSPVPLTSSASSEHVLPATIYSKSVLRAVAGTIAKQFDDVDYFPSYEIISTPFTGRVFYDANLRSVSQQGVDTVMSIFLREHGVAIDAKAPPSPVAVTPSEEDEAERVVCEEMLLEAFAR